MYIYCTYYMYSNTNPQLVENRGTAGQFLEYCTRFYTLIPHDFGLEKPPLLDTADAIKVCLSVSSIILLNLIRFIFLLFAAFQKSYRLFKHPVCLFLDEYQISKIANRCLCIQTLFFVWLLKKFISYVNLKLNLLGWTIFFNYHLIMQTFP